MALVCYNLRMATVFSFANSSHWHPLHTSDLTISSYIAVASTCTVEEGKHPNNRFSFLASGNFYANRSHWQDNTINASSLLFQRFEQRSAASKSIFVRLLATWWHVGWFSAVNHSVVIPTLPRNALSMSSPSFILGAAIHLVIHPANTTRTRALALDTKMMWCCIFRRSPLYQPNLQVLVSVNFINLDKVTLAARWILEPQ